jgi:hypothetical protein
MARKSNEKLSKDMASALEKALENDLADTAQLDDFSLDLSLDDLETQITNAVSEVKAAAAAPVARPATSLNPAAPQVASRPESVTLPGSKPQTNGAAASASVMPQVPQTSAPVREAPKPASAPVAQAQKTDRPAPLPPAANDDSLRSYAATLRNLNKRLPTTLYWLTGLASAAWVLASLYVAYVFYGSTAFSAENILRFLKTPSGIALAIATILPVILFWAFALMVRRAQELRIVAQSMTEVAFRLSEPETLAQDRVMAVGQAVRREVAAMSEGIERTLARASELETAKFTSLNALIRTMKSASVRSLKI